MVAGVVTSKHVLLYTPLIVRAYGIRCYLHLLRAVVSGRRTTFLEVISR